MGSFAIQTGKNMRKKDRIREKHYKRFYREQYKANEKYWKKCVVLGYDMQVLDNAKLTERVSYSVISKTSRFYRRHCGCKTKEQQHDEW